MKAAKVLSLLLLVAPAWCSTKILMHNVSSPVSGYRYATKTQGQGTTTSVTNSVNGPTSGVQLTKTAGGAAMVWISPPLATAATISGTVTMNAYAAESQAACNCGMQVTVRKYSSGAEGATVLNSERGTELGTTISLQNWTAAPTSTSFAVGDRIVVKWWINDSGGNMGSNKSVTTDYDGKTAGADGDTWVQFNETLSFQFEPEVIQNKNANVSSQSSVTVTLNSTGAGHMLAVVIGTASPSTMVTSVHDNGTGGCIYQEATSALAYLQSSGGMTDIWFCPNSTAGTTSVTATVSPTPQGALTAWVYEVYGLVTNSPLDASGNRVDITNKKTSVHSGFVLNPTAANDFMVEAYAGPSGSLTAVTSPWTLDATPATNGSVYLTDTATGALFPTFSNSQAENAVMSGAAFRQHQPPVVNAGANQTITLPNSASLSGSATDDDLPNVTLTYAWSKVSGPGTVTFNSPTSAVTTATFSTTGTYVLQLTANDSLLSGSATTTITVIQGPVVSAGPNQTITLPANAVTLNGSATCQSTCSFVGWSVVSGPTQVLFLNASSAHTTALFSATGAYVLRLTATDTQQLTASADATITINPPAGTPASASIVLSPSGAGPILVGTSQQLVATVRDGSNAPIANATVNFTVTGPNARTGTATTAADGTASFSYTGSQSGVDSVVATSTLGSLTVTSNTSMINWVAGSPQITTSSVVGKFFTSDGSGTFDTPNTAQPVFTQTFASVDFNPPAGTVPGTPSSIDVNTRPFTDVITDANGNFSSSVIAQGNGFQAGVGQLSVFQAVFTGTFTAAAAGNATFNFFNADGFIFGVNNNATRVSGSYVKPPASGVTPFNSYPVMGAFNTVTAPVANTVTVHFPAAGTYSFELDYALSNQVPLIAAGSTWKYSVCPATNPPPGCNPSGFYLLGFDDSNFALGQAPFTDTLNAPSQATPSCPLIGKTYFPVGGILDVRKTVNMPAGVSGIQAFVAIDNDFTLWVNGTQIINQSHELCAFEWNFTVPIPDNVWLPGNNLIAVQARDRGVSTGFEFQLSGPSNPSFPPKQLTLMMSSATTNGQSTLTLSPGTNFSRTLGQSAGFTALLTNASGAVAPNVQVTFNIAGANPQQLTAVTDANGVATFSYFGFFAGSDIIQAQAQLTDAAVVSTQTQVSWNYFSSPPPTGSLTISPTNPPSLAAGQMQTFTVQALDAMGAPAPNVAVTLLVSIANTLQQNATTNSSGIATFNYSGTNAGNDTVQAVANINGTVSFTNIVTVTWTVPGGGGGGTVTFVPQGWIAQPTIGTSVDGQVPITLASGISLTSGTLKYWPTSNPSDAHTINNNTTGTGTIGTLDTTLLANGQYTIQLQATSSSGASQTSAIVVSVIGENKPGRIITTVTEFKVPLAGMPITISRTYDSLKKGKAEDFGFGWALATTVDLEVDALKNVTFTLAGKRQTFFFTAQSTSIWFGWLLSPHYIPQAGLHGTLTADGCSALIRVQGNLMCFDGEAYQPTTYTYTDPVGRVYTISANGQLQSIKDLNGNTITVTPNGITSSVGGTNVTFVRDQTTGQITDIYDLNHNDYHYGYDGSGNLQSVQYPGLSAAEIYTYGTDHSLQTEKDPRQNTSTSVYYDSTNDGGNPSLDGRLKSITLPAVPDPNGGNGTVQFTTQYSYSPSTNQTTITNTDGGTITRTDNSFGKPLSVTEQVDASTSRTTTYQYDASQNLKAATDPLGHTINYTYDSNGFQTSMQLQGLPADSKTYNQFGEITSQTDAAGTNTITTTYDANFNPIQVTDLLPGGGTVATYSNYDSMGNFHDSNDANGKAKHFDYYQSGAQTGYLQDVIRNNSQEKTSYTYDAMGKVLTITDACGNGSCADMVVGTSHTTTNTYDQLERLSTVTDAAGIVTRYVYDDNGNKTDEYDDNVTLQRHTHWDYDALNRVSKITYADGTMKQFFYDFRGNKTTEIDRLGHVTKYVYDLAGQLTSVTYAYGTVDAGTVSYAYYLDGRQKTITDETNQSTGLHTTNTYDPAGRLTSVQDPLGNLTSYGYDADGRHTSVTEPNNQVAQLSTTYEYDARGRLKTITYPPTATQLATTRRYTYDGMGRVLTSQDQNGLITTKTYDDVGRLKTVKDAMNPPNGFITTYAYDLNGNLQSILDANQHTTSFQYDTMNRRAHRILPLGQIEDYTYDALGRLKTKTDFNRKMTTYNYDSLDRLLSKVPDSSLSQPTISFTYTAGGQLCSASGQRCSMTDASGITNYSSYDNRDRLKIKATPEGTLTYTYDAHGNVLTIASSNTNGASMTYTYDALNRLASAKDNRIAAQGGSSNPTTYSYDATGNPTGYVYPNTAQTGNLFDPLNRLTQTCAATSSPPCSAGTKLSSYLYGLAVAGNRLSVTEASGRLVSYLYDNDYRLTKETIQSDPANNGTVSYTGYDNVGNRTAMTSNLSAVPSGSFSYDNNDRLNTVEAYDDNGNMTSSGMITNIYDFENRMTQHGSVQLQYDGDGNRVSETAGGITTKYLVDTFNPTRLPQVLDETVNGSVTRTYAYGLQRISENQLVGSTWTPSFYGYDGHGNVRFLTSIAGAVTDNYDYDAFGMPIRTSGTTPNVFLYSGERFDSGVGLYDLRARYYNQATGRFWARDPEEHNCCGQTWGQNAMWDRNTVWDQDTVRLWAKQQLMRGTRCCGSCSPQEFNPYIYADDDPVNRVDPMGHEALLEWLGNVFNRIKIYVVALRMGNDDVCTLIYADDMLACSMLPSGIAERCALFATERYVQCLNFVP